MAAPRSRQAWALCRIRKGSVYSADVPSTAPTITPGGELDSVSVVLRNSHAEVQRVDAEGSSGGDSHLAPMLFSVATVLTRNQEQQL